MLKICTFLQGEVCHDMVKDLPYMDQVINEVMRLYPSLPRLYIQLYMLNQTVL